MCSFGIFLVELSDSLERSITSAEKRRSAEVNFKGKQKNTGDCSGMSCTKKDRIVKEAY